MSTSIEFAHQLHELFPAVTIELMQHDQRALVSVTEPPRKVWWVAPDAGTYSTYSTEVFVAVFESPRVILPAPLANDFDGQGMVMDAIAEFELLDAKTVHCFLWALPTEVPDSRWSRDAFGVVAL